MPTRQYKAALEVANKARATLGLPPVDHLYPGKPGDPFSCAITETVYDDDLDREKYVVRTTATEVDIFEDAKVVKSRPGSAIQYVLPKDYEGEPMYVAQKPPIHWIHMDPDSRTFIERFDDGRYRTLIKKDV